MKRRIVMVSAMILLVGSQVQMYAQKKGGPDHKRPGMEMKMDRRPGGPMDKKAICQGDIERLLVVEMREKGGRMFDDRKPRLCR